MSSHIYSLVGKGRLLRFKLKPRPHGMCYSHFVNEVCDGAISIKQWGFINDRYKVNPVGQWGKILIMPMGFVDHFGLRVYFQSLVVVTQSTSRALGFL